MTGYGKATADAAGRRFTVEVRSLNSKQLDLSVRMPASLRGLDSAVRAATTAAMQRGKVDVTVTVESESAGRGVQVNEALFADYYARLSRLGNFGADALLQSVLRFPDVVSGEADEAGEAESQAVMDALAEALTHADGFREQEGRRLMDDVLARVGLIETLLAEVAPFEAARTEAIKKRIRESIEKVGVAVDPNRLEQEMIFYVEKLDVTEEKVRLANHCNYFREVAAAEDAPGRKLGFIAQEIGREVNTLGSKANDASIQRIVVAMKDELEKIKEQVLNIL
jgi:uncharacterized protein (TIGR00255 family)